ncbi:hypothetical protein VCR29J2_700304 [Vibrio coralliirubri]|nr:hypothetical protein VCR29J2_700304 [Vibrio coralliirubri]
MAETFLVPVNIISRRYPWSALQRKGYFQQKLFLAKNNFLLRATSS